MINDTEAKLSEGFPYPIYPNVSHLDSMYYDIRKYLILSLNNKNKSDYPDYILNRPDVDNQKKYFRNRIQLFKLNDNNDLMIKVFNKKKRN